MARLIRLMNKIHRIVGDRPAYVENFPDGYPGLVYFLADLKPAPIPLEPATMLLTETQRIDFGRTFLRDVAPRTGAVLTDNPTYTEPSEYLSLYPHARKVALLYRGKPYYVLLR